MATNTIEFLKKHHPNGVTELNKQLGIHATNHPALPIFLLKYDQIESPKTHSIVRECRTLIVEFDTYKVVSRAFPRFFNLGEDLKGEKEFNWANFVVQEKIDGSKINLFHYAGEWHISTSGSFGFGEILDTGKTWRDLFFGVLNPLMITTLHKEYTYVFEFCSPYTKVVKYYPTAQLFLLGVFHNETGEELSLEDCRTQANWLRVGFPQTYPFSSAQECIESLEKTEATFEGYVLVDDKKNRLKLKSKSYLALSQLSANGNIFLGKNLIKLIVDKPGEKDEIVTYFPEVLPSYEDYERKINGLFKELDEIYLLYNDLNKKQYALAIKGEKHFKQGVLFTAYTNKTSPSNLKRKFLNHLIEFLVEKKCK
jgi:hypothetical protein